MAFKQKKGFGLSMVLVIRWNGDSEHIFDDVGLSE